MNGWVCPKCNGSVSPMCSMCPRCSTPTEVVTSAAASVETVKEQLPVADKPRLLLENLPRSAGDIYGFDPRASPEDGKQ